MEKELLIKGLVSLEIGPSDSIINSFANYLHELKKWNKAYNLTALTKDEDIIIKHFIDSLLYLKAIDSDQWPVASDQKPKVSQIRCSASQCICDIGSGAGFPGAAIAIVRPDLKITLIEPSRKKAAFLRNLKRALSLDNVEVLESRVEDVESGLFDIAMTRALFTISDLIKKAGHVLKENGLFVLSKGPKLEEEIKQLGPGIECEVLTVPLPLTPQQRNIIKCRLLND